MIRWSKSSETQLWILLDNLKFSSFSYKRLIKPTEEVHRAYVDAHHFPSGSSRVSSVFALYNVFGLFHYTLNLQIKYLVTVSQPRQCIMGLILRDDASRAAGLCLGGKVGGGDHRPNSQASRAPLLRAQERSYESCKADAPIAKRATFRFLAVACHLPREQMLPC